MVADMAQEFVRSFVGHAAETAGLPGQATASGFAVCIREIRTKFV
jgi:hypothetical protein